MPLSGADVSAMYLVMWPGVLLAAAIALAALET